jgi:hypothetical protein
MTAKENKLECFFLVILSGSSSSSKAGSIPYNLVKLFFIFSNGGKNKLVFLSGFSDSYSEHKAGSIPYNLIKLFSSLMKAKEEKLECFFQVILSGSSM